MGVTYERECPDCGIITRNLGAHMKRHEREIAEAKARGGLHAVFNQPVLPYEKRELDRQLTEFAKEAIRRDLLEGDIRRLHWLHFSGRISELLYRWALLERESDRVKTE